MPLLGWRAVQVTERRTAVDFAEVVRWLVEEVHEEAEKVVLVMDNLNTHKIASLYEAFPPERARRIAERLEIHHTPKHGSWLNMAEIELSVLARQCLDRRIESARQLNSGGLLGHGYGACPRRPEFPTSDSDRARAISGPAPQGLLRAASDASGFALFVPPATRASSSVTLRSRASVLLFVASISRRGRDPLLPSSVAPRRMGGRKTQRTPPPA